MINLCSGLARSVARQGVIRQPSHSQSTGIGALRLARPPDGSSGCGRANTRVSPLCNVSSWLRGINVRTRGAVAGSLAWYLTSVSRKEQGL